MPPRVQSRVDRSVDHSNLASHVANITNNNPDTDVTIEESKQVHKIDYEHVP